MNPLFSGIPETALGYHEPGDEVPPTAVGTDTTAPASLPPDEQVKLLTERFDAAWRIGKEQPPRMKAFLADAPAICRDRLFAELLRIDLDYRVDRLELPQASDYLAEFPGDAQCVHSAFHARLLEKLFLGRKIGSGGMGSVFKALHTRLRRLVAVKMLQSERLDDVRWRARFRQETEACGAMRQHPNLVYVNDAGEFNGNYYLEMEWIDGFDLARLCGEIPAADACELIRQAAEGLQCLYEHGFVHRDIKPSNLMLSRDSTCKVLDLGLVQIEEGLLTASEGGLLGTIAYMSPEQCKNPREVDIRADIYSLGCTLFHLLTGSVPFGPPEHESLFAVISAHRESPPPRIRDLNPKLDEALEAVDRKMMAKDPAARYSTPAEVAEVLSPFAAGSDLRSLLESKGVSPAKSNPSGPPARRGSSPSRAPSKWASLKRAGLRIDVRLRWGILTALLATFAVLGAWLKLSPKPPSLPSSFAALPALDGEWWFDETPWFIPSARSAVVEAAAAKAGAESSANVTLPIASAWQVSSGVSSHRFAELLKESVGKVCHARGRSGNGCDLFFASCPKLDPEHHGPDEMFNNLCELRERLRERAKSRSADSAPSDAVAANASHYWARLPAAECHLLAVIVHKLALQAGDAAPAAGAADAARAEMNSANEYWDECKLAYQDAIDKYIQLDGQDDAARHLRALCMVDFARMHLDRGKTDDARSKLMEAESSETSAESPLFYFDVQLIFADTYQRDADWPAAEACLKKAQARADQVHVAAQHPIRAAIWQKMAWLYMDWNNPSQAEGCFQKADEIQARHLQDDPRAQVFQYHNRHGRAVALEMKAVEDAHRGTEERKRLTAQAREQFAGVVSALDKEIDGGNARGQHYADLLERALNAKGRQADCYLFGLPHDLSGAAGRYEQAADFADKKRMHQSRFADEIALLRYKAALAFALLGDSLHAQAALAKAEKAYAQLPQEANRAKLVRAIAAAAVKWSREQSAADLLAAVKTEVNDMLAKRKSGDGPKLQRNERQPLALLLEYAGDDAELREMAGLQNPSP